MSIFTPMLLMIALTVILVPSERVYPPRLQRVPALLSPSLENCTKNISKHKIHHSFDSVPHRCFRVAQPRSLAVLLPGLPRGGFLALLNRGDIAGKGGQAVSLIVAGLRDLLGLGIPFRHLGKGGEARRDEARWQRTKLSHTLQCTPFRRTLIGASMQTER